MPSRVKLESQEHVRMARDIFRRANDCIAGVEVAMGEPREELNYYKQQNMIRCTYGDTRGGFYTTHGIKCLEGNTRFKNPEDSYKDGGIMSVKATADRSGEIVKIQMYKEYFYSPYRETETVNPDGYVFRGRQYLGNAGAKYDLTLENRDGVIILDGQYNQNATDLPQKEYLDMISDALNQTIGVVAEHVEREVDDKKLKSRNFSKTVYFSPQNSIEF